MNTQATQIRVTLPAPLQEYLQAKASKYGLSLSAYVKNLIINDVKDIEHPVYRMSDQSLKDYKEAKKAQAKDTLIEVRDTSTFLKDLY